MINTNAIRCRCCNKKLGLLSVEPEFYCSTCVNQKEIHNSEDDVNPIKWYSKISNDIFKCQKSIQKKIWKIESVNKSNKSKECQMRKYRVENIKLLINKLNLQKENKVIMKKSIQDTQIIVTKNISDVNEKLDFTIKRLGDLSLNAKELSDRILKIQIYLNELQFIFINEILNIFPIILSKYEFDKICDLPFHIDLSDSSVLESNDSTASAIILLTILATSISFVLDICYSSMDFKKFAFKTICQQSTPLKRDEIMYTYQFLVKIVHHITQSTLFRSDNDKKELLKILPAGSLTKSSSTDLNAEHYPLKKLVLFRDNLNLALFMTNISNPYVLELPDMFKNKFINEFSISKITSSRKDDDILGFEILSSIIPMDELPSIYHASTNNDHPLISKWLTGIKDIL